MVYNFKVILRATLPQINLVVPTSYDNRVAERE